MRRKKIRKFIHIAIDTIIIIKIITLLVVNRIIIVIIIVFIILLYAYILISSLIAHFRSTLRRNRVFERIMLSVNVIHV